MKKSVNAKQSAQKSVYLGVTATGGECGEEFAKSVKGDSCAFLLTAFGVLIVGVLGGEASCSLFILTGVSPGEVLVNDFLVAD